MTYLNLFPILALIIVVLITIGALFRNGHVPKNAWVIAALFCGFFTAWSVVAIIKEGPFGFWPVHTESFWGNQVWFDLLMALTMAWVLILPRARALGMKSPLWLIFILCSGSIGFSAMLARLLYLEKDKT